MKGARDAAIKLFGKEITLPDNGRTLAFSGEYSVGDCGDKYGRSDHDRSSVMAACLEDKKVSRTGDEEQKEEEQLEADLEDPLAVNPTGSKQQDKSTPPTTEEPGDPGMSPESDENPKPPSGDEETATPKPPKTENDEIDTENPQQKPLKKPDKILPCGRCNSMDTKFCYYNNYNINQPRHFCKSCQRYWTAGGTMRSVPVGAGRRKNKNPASHCRHITISEALQSARIDAPNGIHLPAFKTNGTVLSFGPEAPICESMASVLSLAGKTAPNGKVEQGMPIAGNGGENGDDCSSGSSVTTSNSVEEGARNGIQEPMMRNFNGFSPQIPCLPGVPWPYPWNSAAPLPAFCPSGFPMPFYPAPYWTCSVPGAWSVPWLSSTSPAENQNAPNSAPNSSTLGKHSRDGDLLKPSNPDEKETLEHKNSERSILIPKTLRIDDTDEAAKSSMWATLGIKNDPIGRRGLFKAFQPKGAEKNRIAETLPALRANPAALSRSLSFQAGA